MRHELEKAPTKAGATDGEGETALNVVVKIGWMGFGGSIVEKEMK